MASKGQKFKKHNSDIKEIILDRYLNGESSMSLDKEFGISHNTIQTWGKKIKYPEKYLKNNGGYDYKLYNHICPDKGEPDSNIVEYAEDVLYMINLLINNK